MRATDVMRSTVITIGIDASLADAVALMLEHGINAMPVTGARGEVRGMVGIRDALRAPWAHASERPILRWDRLDEKARHLAETRVGQVMARRVVSVSPEADVIEVAAIMANRGVHPIPVLDGERLLGVIGRADVARVLLALARGADDDDITRSGRQDAVTG